MNGEPLVSVICLTYNHEKYIAKALESFVTQETDFPFEVIVHDDASTDTTAAIVKEYEEKYPHIIKPIYQTENQYIKKVNAWLECELHIAKGKYIAVCEGDDYWTDVKKLQKQYDYMEMHPDCPMVVHESIRIFEDGRYMSSFSDFDFSAEGAGFIEAEEMVCRGNDFHTSALFYRKEYVIRNQAFLRTVPQFDYVVKFLVATDNYVGKTYVIPEKMSAYRVSTVGSWSRRVRDDPDQSKKHLQNAIDVFHKLDAYREFKYTDALQVDILRRQFAIGLLEKDKRIWKDPKYKNLRKEMSLKVKAINYLRVYMPHVFQMAIKMRSRIKNR